MCKTYKKSVSFLKCKKSFFQHSWVIIYLFQFLILRLHVPVDLVPWDHVPDSQLEKKWQFDSFFQKHPTLLSNHQWNCMSKYYSHSILTDTCTSRHSVFSCNMRLSLCLCNLFDYKHFFVYKFCGLDLQVFIFFSCLNFSFQHGQK